jgi:hypothetical protein
MTPNIAYVRIESPNWRSIPMWIPLFLLWIPAIILSPLIFLVILGLSLAGKLNPWNTVRVLWDLVCALPGTHVRVTADETNVNVRIL